MRGKKCQKCHLLNNNIIKKFLVMKTFLANESAKILTKKKGKRMKKKVQEKRKKGERLGTDK
jgi:hypothetical protein